MKMLKNLIIAMLAFGSLGGLQGCSNTKAELDPGTMRVWLSPANRAEVDASNDGYVFVKVDE